ncbi:putative phage-type endonuclease [Formivibrio citricus]|uniref:Putative phage-type endonuclease n=1 Tax=Formivibrio citricus TaxID=83765 RepID=A0A1I4Z4V1_9NEIS|nr:YqaJ viral recombinase family protein [Formivibrio citricus]SFN45295.1 putative phage-type endonuclease [Formivibrio citricus]
MNNRSNVVRLVSTQGMSREQWLAVRRGGIGSSDAAAAIGLSPYKSALELWLEKTGRKSADDFSQSEAVFWGTTLEAIIANVYANRTGNKVRRVNAVLQHPDHPFMLANLDRAVGADGVLEVKTAGGHSAKFWEDGVPEHYQCQVIHQLAVTGKAWADVAVLIGGQDFRIYRIERDESQIADLIERETLFWGMLESDVQPAVDGSESSGSALAFLYPRDSGIELDCSESAELNALFTRLLQVRADLGELERSESLLRQQLQSAMGEATAARFVGGRISWKCAKDSTRFDMTRFQTDHPDLVNQYQQISPGSRRFLVQVDKPKPQLSPQQQAA